MSPHLAPPRVLATALAALALAPAIIANSRTAKPAAAATASRALVSYVEERNGVVFRYTSLTVSKHGLATVRSKGRVNRFRLGPSSWRRLKAALRRTDLRALAGDHGPVTRRAEESTWLIVAGRYTVRITAFSMPAKLRMKLEPLLKVLIEIVSTGKRSMPRA